MTLSAGAFDERPECLAGHGAAGRRNQGEKHGGERRLEETLHATERGIPAPAETLPCAVDPAGELRLH